MTPCARGCCWSPFGCAKARECDCHWGDWLLTPQGKRGSAATYRNPTENQAIANVMRNQQRRE